MLVGSGFIGGHRGEPGRGAGAARRCHRLLLRITQLCQIRSLLGPWSGTLLVNFSPQNPKIGKPREIGQRIFQTTEEFGRTLGLMRGLRLAPAGEGGSSESTSISGRSLERVLPGSIPPLTEGRSTAPCASRGVGSRLCDSQNGPGASPHGVFPGVGIPTGVCKQPNCQSGCWFSRRFEEVQARKGRH